MCARNYAVNAMSHGASTVTKATRGAAKGGLSQAEVWEKVSAIQKGLSGFRVQFDSLEKALRTHVPSTGQIPRDSAFCLIKRQDSLDPIFSSLTPKVE